MTSPRRLSLAFVLAALAALPSRADELSDALSEANALLKRGKAKEARAKLEPLAAKHADSPKLHYALGQAAVLLKDFKAATKSFERTVELDPAQLDARLVLATLYRKEKKSKEARKQLDEVLKKDPARVSALESIGELELDARRFAEAAGGFEKALERRPDDPKLTLLAASAWAESTKALRDGPKKKRDEHGAKAIALYRKLLEKEGADIELQYNLGTIGILCERWDEAIAALEAFLKERPDDPRGLYNLAQAHERKGGLKEAIATWKRFIQAVEGAAEKPPALRGELAAAKERIKALEKELAKPKPKDKPKDKPAGGGKKS